MKAFFISLRHYVTSRKVVDSRPMRSLHFFFNLPNPSSRTLSPDLTQSLTEMSTRKCFWVVERSRLVKADNLAAICELIV
jgi:hypothetical protein